MIRPASADAGEADAVSFGKTFIANPDLPRRLQLNAALNPYDNTTFNGYGQPDFAVGYTDYAPLRSTSVAAAWGVQQPSA